MPWTYSQSTGNLTDPTGAHFATGFAGRDAGYDNPSEQFVSNVGPLPQGQYTMSQWFDHHPTVGLCAIELTPFPDNIMHDRSGFFVHGPSATNPSESSHGCIVAGNCNTRAAMWANADHVITVVA